MQLTVKVGGNDQTEDSREYVLKYLTQRLSNAYHNVSHQDTMLKLKSMMDQPDEKMYRVHKVIIIG
jgi:hypothetical protein